MNRAYWEDLSDTYEEEIFSVLHRDHEGRLKGLIEEYGDRSKSAADLGCGPGQITPLLAKHFGEVHACDLSEGLLARARAKCAGFRNVSFHRSDLSSDVSFSFPPVDLVVCVNVIITADLARRERLWQTVTGQVDRGGTLILVLPSHESALYANYRRLDWNLRSGLSANDALLHSHVRHGNVAQMEIGVREIEGVETKHYLQEEITVQLQDRSLQVEEIAKLPYDWNIEFPDPPEWMEAPYPWNWLVVARRPG